MADSKISALPAATTPLAGTEVLPIVQSSTTKQVANNDLRPKQIQSNATSGVLQIAGPASATTRVMTTPDANFSVARIDAAQSFTGDQTLSTGNLVIGTAGKGIDFSADPSAAGMTSELLDDYEEGTFTATFTPSTSGTITLSGSYNTLSYTKVGRVVTVTGEILVASSSAPVGTSVTIGGFPFAAGAGTSSSAGFSVTDLGTLTARVGRISTTSTTADMFITASTIGTNSNFMFGFSYIT